MDLDNRARGAIFPRINAEHAGRDIIAVAHGRTIKAAIGFALGEQPEKGLAFDTDNCSVTWSIISQARDTRTGGCR